MARHNQLGKAGEQAAVDFLISKGFTVRHTNWRFNHLEIDIIAQEAHTNTLHIVEVKTRAYRNEHYDPMSAINSTKVRHLVDAANAYVQCYHLQMEVQYDVMIVIGSGDNLSIDYMPDAFMPPLRTHR